MYIFIALHFIKLVEILYNVVVTFFWSAPLIHTGILSRAPLCTHQLRYHGVGECKGVEAFVHCNLGSNHPQGVALPLAGDCEAGCVRDLYSYLSSR